MAVAASVAAAIATVAAAAVFAFIWLCFAFFFQCFFSQKIHLFIDDSFTPSYFDSIAMCIGYLSYV